MQVTPLHFLCLKTGELNVAFLAELVTTLTVDGVGRAVTRAHQATRKWARGYVRWGRPLRETDARIGELREALVSAGGTLERVGDHLLQLDKAGAPFDLQKVLIAAHTMGCFKLPQPMIMASAREVNTLNVNCGRRHGVVAGVCLSIVSKDGAFRTRHTLRDADIRDDHVCIRPPELDLCSVDAGDLVVSFAQGPDPTASERALSLLLDEALSAATEIKSVLALRTGATGGNIGL